MIICVAGKNDIAVDVLEYLIKNNSGRYDLCVICNQIRKELPGFQKSLFDFAKVSAVPIVELEDTYDLDDLIFLSMEYDRIVKPKKFKNARLYNIHFSYLPEYKGMYTSALPILNGEEYTGVTFHRIDEGIDTGDIIDRRKIIIEKEDNCRDLYLKYLDEGTKIVIDNIEEVIKGKEELYRQSYVGASYYPIGYIDYQNLVLNVNDVAESIERQIRAYSFREYQMPSYSGFDIISCEITDEKSFGFPGAILDENESYIKMATIDYVVKLYKDRVIEMFEACQTGDLIKIKEICVCKEHIRITDEHGWTPIIVATYNNHLSLVEYLLSEGADPFVTNYNGTNLLMYAKEAYKTYGDRRLFDMYIEIGVNPKSRDKKGLDIVDYIKKESLQELLGYERA